MARFGCALVVTYLFAVTSVKGLQCVLCLSELDPKCINNPPPPIQCERDASHCMLVREFSQNGTMVSLTRTCSPIGLGNVEECEDGTTSDGKPARVCHKTCKIDGCNTSDNASLDTFLLMASMITFCAISYQ
ncbi:U-scoloptoxin(05)-Cw1a-like [Artemia franciscana]|uniref:U-scoloptoxin(05)-Cw1a-like n=1 Tax=Artemia franciscana TaxID=6661 RepID=UPI0032DB8209